MNALSDNLLNAGCVTNIENVHAETITVLTGVDAGKKFIAVNETDPDVNLNSDLINDPRGARFLRFRNFPGNLPRIGKLDTVQTADGRKWKATLNPTSSYLTVDYKIVQTT